MSEQLPTVAELVAFAVAAGEGPLAALDRVAVTVRGELAGEFGLAVRRVRGGTAFPSALRDMSDAVPSLEASRFSRGV
jgi:tight adherence protein C